VVGGVVGAVVLGGGAAVAVPRLSSDCGRDVTEVTGARSDSPFLDARQRAARPDHDRDALVTALDAAPAPFGKVLGGVGYHYEQWAQVSAFAQGIGVRTRDNPDFTMLDDRTLKPRWSVRVGTRRSTYDASDTRYLVAALSTGAAPDLVALDADDGHRVWCTTLDAPEVTFNDPFATQVLDGGGVAVLTRGSGSTEQVVRLDGRDGSQRWRRGVAADEGDFLGSLGDGLLLAGGTSHERLADPRRLSQRRAGQSLVAISAKNGRRRWTLDSAAGAGMHVIGTDPDAGLALVEQWTGQQGRVLALDRAGRQVWSVSPGGPAHFDVSLRAGRVLVRAGNAWSAYAARDGHVLWRRTVPEKPQFLPYGFALADLPLLDDDHALVGGTTALHVLDLDTGAMTSAALPTDGINTTYWPYEVAVSPGLVAVATNTGAAVVRRTSGG
jgi:outer membrane protein assembly factor BamB